MKVVIPDLVSNSYFPAIAAVEMGFFKEEGLDAELELIYPVGKCYEALGDTAKAINFYEMVTAYDQHPRYWDATEAVRRLKAHP